MEDWSFNLSLEISITMLPGSLKRHLYDALALQIMTVMSCQNNCTIIHTPDQ